MSDLSEALKPYIGLESHTDTACDVVERGAVRRYAQAIMNEDPIFSVECENNKRYGKVPVAFSFTHSNIYSACMCGGVKRYQFYIPYDQGVRGKSPNDR